MWKRGQKGGSVEMRWCEEGEEWKIGMSGEKERQEVCEEGRSVEECVKRGVCGEKGGSGVCVERGRREES